MTRFSRQSCDLWTGCHARAI